MSARGFSEWLLQWVLNLCAVAYTVEKRVAEVLAVIREQATSVLPEARAGTTNDLFVVSTGTALTGAQL